MSKHEERYGSGRREKIYGFRVRGGLWGVGVEERENRLYRRYSFYLSLKSPRTALLSRMFATVALTNRSRDSTHSRTNGTDFRLFVRKGSMRRVCSECEGCWHIVHPWYWLRQQLYESHRVHLHARNKINNFQRITLDRKRLTFRKFDVRSFNWFLDSLRTSLFKKVLDSRLQQEKKDDLQIREEEWCCPIGEGPKLRRVEQSRCSSSQRSTWACRRVQGCEAYSHPRIDRSVFACLPLRNPCCSWSCR